MLTAQKIAFITVIVFITELSCSVVPHDDRYPIELTKEGFVVATLNLADSINGKFIFDSGAGIHVVAPTVLRKIPSTPKGRFTGFRHTGERVDLDIVQIPSMSIGRFRQDRPIVAIWPFLDSLRIDGILSLKFFEHHPFTLDFRDSAVVFENSYSLAERSTFGVFRPIRVDDVREVSLDVFADIVTSTGIHLECIIDTGSPSTVLDVRFANQLGIDTASSEVRRRSRKSPFGSMETEFLAVVPSLSLTDDSTSNIKNMRILLKHNMIYDGLIGLDWLRGRTLTIDVPGRRFYLAAGGN